MAELGRSSRFYFVMSTVFALFVAVELIGGPEDFLDWFVVVAFAVTAVLMVRLAFQLRRTDS